MIIKILGDERMKGILDRIEDGDQAVILVEEIQKALIIPLSELPKGSKEGTYFNLNEKGGQFYILSIDDETTKKEAQKSMDLMEKLRSKSKESKFKRK